MNECVLVRVIHGSIANECRLRTLRRRLLRNLESERLFDRERRLRWSRTRRPKSVSCHMKHGTTLRRF